MKNYIRVERKKEVVMNVNIVIQVLLGKFDNIKRYGKARIIGFNVIVCLFMVWRLRWFMSKRMKKVSVVLEKQLIFIYIKEWERCYEMY